MENGFMIWSFSGQPICKLSRDRFFHFAWRPRPACLLPAERLREVAKNLKLYSRRYEEEDEAIIAAVDSVHQAERERLLAEWRDWRATKDGWVEEQKKGEKALLGDKWREPEEEFVVEEVEVSAVVDMREEPAKLTM
jgi:translation initiation factor 3 subunit B